MGSATTVNQVHDILRRYTGPLQAEMDVEAVYLFGSYAAGTANDASDIDVAVVSPDFKGVRFYDNVRLAKLGRAVDVRIEARGFRPEEFNDSNVLPTVVLETGIKIYPEA